MGSEWSLVGARGRHSTMKRRALAFVASLLLLGVLQGPTLAAATLDQHNENVSLGIASAAARVAQTFTVGKTGTLSHVGLYLQTPAPRIVDVDIYALDGSGVPTGSSLDNAKLTISNMAKAWISFPLHRWRHVNSGEKYAIVFNIGAGYDAWGSTNTYSRGRALLYNGTWVALANNSIKIADFGFRTFVDSSAPAPTPTPTPTPTPKPTPKATPTPVAAASSSASAPAASLFPSAPASPVSTASAVASEPAASASPTASGSPGAVTANSTSGSSGSPLLIVAAIIVVLALAGGGLWFMLMRRRKTAGSPPLGPTEGGAAPTAPAS